MNQAGGTAIGMGGVMMTLCHCGNPKPLMVPFSTDGASPVTCPSCRTQFVVAKIDYDVKKPNELKLGVGWISPAIQPATIEDIKQLSRGKPS